MTRTRRSFTDEFKREAVKLVKQPGAMVTHIARDLGIEASVLRRWVSRNARALWTCDRIDPFAVKLPRRSNDSSGSCAASRWSVTS